MEENNEETNKKKEKEKHTEVLKYHIYASRNSQKKRGDNDRGYWMK